MGSRKKNAPGGEGEAQVGCLRFHLRWCCSYLTLHKPLAKVAIHIKALRVGFKGTGRSCLLGSSEALPQLPPAFSQRAGP